MQLHASCAALRGAAVLLTGPAGSGKSDLLLRLLDRGFSLVADDRVEFLDGMAWAPPALAGLLEVRGLGIVRLPYTPSAPVALLVRMGEGNRLPEPAHELGLPIVHVDPGQASAAQRVDLALRCVRGEAELVVGGLR